MKTGRKLNSYKVGNVKNYEHIPTDHECIDCARRKNEVNFYCREGVNGWNVNTRCNQCITPYAQKKQTERDIVATKKENRQKRKDEFIARWNKQIRGL